MRLHHHIALSGIVAAASYLVGAPPRLAVAAFVTGFMLDVDHLADYWREYPTSLDVRHFFKTCEEYRLRKVYLWLHSIELLALMLLLAAVMRNAWVYGIALGWFQHLLFDYIGNDVHTKSYFFSYRWSKGFANEKIFDIPHEYRQNAEQTHGNKAST